MSLRMPRSLLFTTCLATLSVAGAAQEDKPYHPHYVGVYGGLNFAPSQTIQSEEDGFIAVDDRDVGYLAGILLGRRFGDFRIELDVARRENALDVVGFLNPTGFVPVSGASFFVSGDVTVHSIMGNLLYAPERFKMFGFQPVLGGGFGAGIVDYNDVGVFFTDEVFLDDSDVGIAAQAIGAFERPLTEHLVAQVGYRYFRTLDTQLNLTNGVAVDTDYGAHSVFGSLQWRWGGRGPKAEELEPADVAPPATNSPPTANADSYTVQAGQAASLNVLANDRDSDGDAVRIIGVTGSRNGKTRLAGNGRIEYEAPAGFSGQDRFTYTIEDTTGNKAQAPVTVDVTSARVPGPFLVFFDFDSAELTDTAREVISSAAEAYRDFGIARLQTVGHTDTSGPDWYNERLSARRAAAVEQALMEAGVPEARIVTTSRGEAEPLVSTGDGVREPQNRRVEINLEQ